MASGSRFRLEITPLSRELQTPAIPGGVLTTLQGNFQTIFKGAGLEFRGFRDLAPTDDAKRIDWKASLKANRMVVREYEEERNAEIIFCYDISEGMIFGSKKKLKNHYGAEFIVSLGKHLVEASDSIGLITFNDKVTKFIPPETGEQQVNLFTDILSSFSTYGGKGKFDEVLDFMNGAILKGTTIILVSDFFHFKKYKKYKEILEIISKKFELIFVILRDPLEDFFESKRKRVVLVNPESNLNILVSTSQVKEEYVKETRKEKKELVDYLKSFNIPILELYTDKPFIEPLYEFFAKTGGRYNR